MDEIYALGFLLLALLLGPWVLLWFRGRRHKRERQEDQRRWQELHDRVQGLERAVAGLIGAESRKTTAAEPIARVQTAAEEPRRLSADTPIPAPPVHAAVTTPAPQFARPKPAESEARVTPVFEYLSRLSQPAASDRSRELNLGGNVGPSLLERIKGELQLEELLGGNLLGKLGIVLLVFGIAFFLAYQLRQVGPAGKVLVGYVVSVALLGGGIFLERRARYHIFARAGIGGGWALLFFTTYAMYHVPAAHVLSSQVVDLLLLLAVAAAMVLHSLRYRSQVVTGMAFLLAFSTVTISHVTVYSLAAGAVLALALVVAAAHH